MDIIFMDEFVQGMTQGDLGTWL